jgi:hypothetical protein
MLEPQNSANQYVMCMWIYMLSDQQVFVTKPLGLTSRLETHKLTSDDLVEHVQNNHGSIMI